MRDYSQSAAVVVAHIQVFINIANQTLISLKALATIVALDKPSLICSCQTSWFHAALSGT